jgi:hypothetical protein
MPRLFAALGFADQGDRVGADIQVDHLRRGARRQAGRTFQNVAKPFNTPVMLLR